MDTEADSALKENAWSVNLEHGDRWWYAHVAELVGCFTRGETMKEVLDALPRVVERECAFLVSKGLPQQGRIGFEIVKLTEGIPGLGEAGGAVALFQTDLKPVKESELGRSFDLMRWNREELMRIIEPLSEYALVATPIPGKWSIDQTLRHIANAEEWYVSRMGAPTQRQYEAYLRGLKASKRRFTSPERLRLVREGALLSLSAAIPEKDAASFKRVAYTQHPEELWTFRKVLRRFVEHEREHIGTISKVIEALDEFSPQPRAI